MVWEGSGVGFWYEFLFDFLLILLIYFLLIFWESWCVGWLRILEIIILKIWG